LGVLALAEETRVDGSTSLLVHGVVDDATVEQFEQHLEHSLDAALSTESGHLILDLTGCRLDSAGLAALVRMQRRVQDPAFTRLVATDVDLLRLMQIVGLLSGVKVYASLDAARRSCRMDGRPLAGIHND
jgi:anti-anti-sigma factor